METSAAPKTGKAEALLNVSHVKSYIKRRSRELRTVWHPDRVSDEAIQDLEYKLRVWIDGAIARHPTRGKTFTEIG